MARLTNVVKQSELVLALDDPVAELSTVGGKGASLARLAGAGLPVSPGFHVSTAAYRMFVERDGLRARIRAAESAAESSG